jgi:hypothetical protein
MPDDGFLSSQHHILGSAVAGFASTLLGHPLDVIKAHLQTNVELRSSYQVLRELQFRGLFRGITPPLFNAILMNTVMFSVFDEVNTIYRDPLVAGLLSGFATAMISTPTDYVKIQAQLHEKSIRSLIRQTSFLSWYGGHLANLAREGVFTMTYLGLYHKIGDSICSDPNANLESNNLLWVAVKSSVTGTMAWIVSYPFDTIKTIVQSGDSRSYYSITQQSMSLSWLYKGCQTSTFRAILVTSSRMIAYEWVTNHMKE